MSTFKKFIQTKLPSNTDLPEGMIRVINQLQTNIQDSFRPLNSKTQNDSNIISNINLIAGKVNTINHLLGQNLSGWKIVRQRGNAIIWDVQDTNTNPSQTLLLNTSANVSIDIEVF